MPSQLSQKPLGRISPKLATFNNLSYDHYHIIDNNHDYHPNVIILTRQDRNDKNLPTCVFSPIPRIIAPAGRPWSSGFSLLLLLLLFCYCFCYCNCIVIVIVRATIIVIYVLNLSDDPEM